MKKQVVAKRNEERTVNTNVLFAEIIPAGISLIAVLGFLASKFLSRYRLKAIAALLAKTMHSTIKTSSHAFIKIGLLLSISSAFIDVGRSLKLEVIPRKNPIKAKGIAKIV
jgi:hypothetical protein